MIAQGPAGNCDTLGCVEPVSASLFPFLWLGTPYIRADGVGMALMLGPEPVLTLTLRSSIVLDCHTRFISLLSAISNIEI